MSHFTKFNIVDCRIPYEYSDPKYIKHIKYLVDSSEFHNLTIEDYKFYISQILYNEINLDHIEAIKYILNFTKIYEIYITPIHKAIYKLNNKDIIKIFINNCDEKTLFSLLDYYFNWNLDLSFWLRPILDSYRNLNWPRNWQFSFKFNRKRQIEDLYSFVFTSVNIGFPYPSKLDECLICKWNWIL